MNYFVAFPIRLETVLRTEKRSWYSQFYARGTLQFGEVFATGRLALSLRVHHKFQLQEQKKILFLKTEIFAIKYF